MLRLAALLLALVPASAQAQSDLLDLSPNERAALGRELRAVLLAEPEIVARALAPSPYADEIAKDRAKLAAARSALFEGADFAFVVSDDCPSCAEALARLTALSDARALRFNTLTSENIPEAANALELDTPPFYIFPDAVYRGAMPDAVIARKLSALERR